MCCCAPIAALTLTAPCLLSAPAAPTYWRLPCCRHTNAAFIRLNSCVLIVGIHRNVRSSRQTERHHPRGKLGALLCGPERASFLSSVSYYDMCLICAPQAMFQQLYNNSIESWCERRSAQGLSCNIPSHRCVCLPLFYSQLSLTVCNFTCGIISFVTSCYLISCVHQIFSLL